VELLKVSTRSLARHAVLELRGELDLSGLEGFCGHLRTACRTHGDRIILDLSELTFIDSSGLSVLVEYDASTRDSGGVLALVAPRPPIRKILSTTGLNRRLIIHDRIEDAVTAA
jgi:anti-sigma B factor antagonist